MDKIVAHDIIEKSFNKAFSEESFRVFIHNLLNDFEHKSNVYSGNLIWNDFKDHIRSYKRIGKYIDPSGEALDILIVEVKDVSKLERARTTLRNFVIKHLLNFEKENALVAFYTKDDNGADWRFSFIKLEYQAELDEKKGKVSIRTKFTPAKRSSFLVGEHEKSYTAKKQLLPILQNVTTNPTIEDIEAAFSVEKVTDEFFDRYKELFVKLTEHFDNDKLIKSELQQSRIDNVRFTKKLLGQIVFLYFLQKKGWLGVSKYEKWSKGDKAFIQNLYSKAEEDGVNFFKDKLQYLFYEALAKERNNENSYYERFQCRIPFLNGGLFEAEYNWKNTNINIPNSLFRNEEKNSAGDVGTGILDVFDRYNFTIKEGDPLDIEVAIDPEMLGKVFENMLEVKDRKSKGAFYTPREIVHYMCQESLIHYLDNALGNEVSKEDIETLVREGHYALENDERVANKGETSTYKYHLPESIRDNADIIDQKLSDIKICDPAIGSGAFPVGLLHELVNAMLVIAPHFSEEYRKQKFKSFGFDNIESITKSRYVYRLKRHIIQESIYGVDIDESAIDIARLRLWLSLIVDEDDLDMIETLPNLDYKIVCGNSLISKYSLDTPINDVFIEFNKKIKDKNYSNETIKKLVGDRKVDLELYKKVTNDYLTESSHEQKLVFREFITEIKNAFKTTLQEKEIKSLSNARGKLQNLQSVDIFGNKIGSKQEIKDAEEDLKGKADEAERVLEGAIYKNALEWRFEFPNLLDDNGSFIGFDIVIGNPPYGAKLTPEEKRLFKNVYSDVHMRTPDTFNYFISKGISLLHNHAVISYIVPNNLFFQSEYEKTRKLLLKENKFHIGVNLGDGVFNTATVPSCIFITSRSLSENNKYKYLDLRSEVKRNINFIDDFKTELVSSTLSTPASVLGITEEEFQIIEKLRNVSITIDDVAEEMASGISTGGDKIFRVSREIATEYKLEKEILKPVLLGSDIDKYQSNSSDYLIIYTNRATDINRYPNIKKYLFQFKEKLEDRSEARTGLMPWYALNRHRYPLLFEENKIIMRQTSDKIRATMDTDGYYVIDSILVFKKVQSSGFRYKYLLAIMNSSISNFVYTKFSQEVGRTFAQVKPLNVRKLLIPSASVMNQNLVAIIVDYLLEWNKIYEKNHKVTKYFELILDAIVFQLFLSKEFLCVGKDILVHLKDLKPITEEMTEEEKLAIIQNEYDRLSHPSHPVRIAIDTLDEVEEVRIIRESLNR